MKLNDEYIDILEIIYLKQLDPHFHVLSRALTEPSYLRVVWRSAG